jgi:hypothetical protein
VGVPGCYPGRGRFESFPRNSQVQILCSAGCRCNGQMPFPERYRRVPENRASLVAERSAAIRTQIPLKRPIVTRTESSIRHAARARDAVIPANLCQQIRGPLLRDERFQWDPSSSGGVAVPRLSPVNSSYGQDLITAPLRKSVLVMLDNQLGSPASDGGIRREAPPRVDMPNVANHN